MIFFSESHVEYKLVAVFYFTLMVYMHANALQFAVQRQQNRSNWDSGAMTTFNPSSCQAVPRKYLLVLYSSLCSAFVASVRRSIQLSFKSFARLRVSVSAQWYSQLDTVYMLRSIYEI